jgi:hypothetical protein
MRVQGSRRVLLTRLNADVLIGVGAKRFVETRAAWRQETVVSWLKGSKRSEVVFADGNAMLMLNSAVGGGLGPHRTSELDPVELRSSALPHIHPLKPRNLTK